MTRGETYAVGGIGVALLGVMMASWADTRAGFTELRAEIRDVRTELRAEIQHESAVLRGDIADLRRELKQDIADLRGDVQKLDDRTDEVTARLVAVEVHTQVLSRTPARGRVPVVEDTSGDTLQTVHEDAL